MMGNYHARCGVGEKPEVVTPEAYLSLFGQIPQFEKLIATIRSREISASIILQSKSQLKALYKDNASTIEGNCDTTLFLGGKEKDTLMIVTAPVILVLTLFVWLCMGLIYISGLVLGLLSTVIALLGVAVIITYSPQNGVILLVIAFLISPMGLPLAAIWLLGKVQDLKYAIQDRVYG